MDMVTGTATILYKSNKKSETEVVIVLSPRELHRRRIADFQDGLLALSLVRSHATSSTKPLCEDQPLRCKIKWPNVPLGGRLLRQALFSNKISNRNSEECI